MQAQYPKKYPTTSWDPLNLEYPVRKFPETDSSSETIGHVWKRPPEVLKSLKDPLTAIKEYFRDYNITKDLTRSQSTLDFSYKHSETKRHNKHTSCTENHYIYPSLRWLADRPPQCTAHGTTEMKSSYNVPTIPARLITDKDQYKHPASLPLDPPAIETSFYKDLEPIDTTHEGFEKLLDPYLTTSRLHHRPYTADQLARPSVTNDVVTYYTYADVTRIRRPKPKIEEWRLPLSMAKSVYDREKFQQGFREIRTHNKLKCVPNAFRTEVRDNYKPPLDQPDSRIHDYEEDVQAYYQQSIANLKTNTNFEESSIRHLYDKTENSHVGSGMALCSVIDQYIAKNRKLENRSIQKSKQFRT